MEIFILEFGQREVVPLVEWTINIWTHFIKLSSPNYNQYIIYAHFCQNLQENEEKMYTAISTEITISRYEGAVIECDIFT